MGFPALCLFLLIVLNLKEYNVWQQILDGYTPGSPLIYLENLASHTARLILMHPIVYFSDLFGIELNKTFSFVVLVIFILINYRVKYWCDLFAKNKGGHKMPFLINSILLIFFLIMNGRNSFSFLANVILFDSLLIIHRKDNLLKSMALALLAGFFCNVSSGTYAVMSLNVFLFSVISFIRKPFSQLFFKTLIILTCSVGVFLPIFISSFIKNLEYYEYSINKMLSHGYGSIILYDVQISVLMVPTLILATLFFSYKILSSSTSKLTYFFWPFLLSSLFGGFFGYSSLIGALPVLLFLFFHTYRLSFKV